MNTIDQAKKALVSAIYFADSSDYLSYTYEALQHLDPELYELCVNDEYTTAHSKSLRQSNTTDGLLADDNTLAVHELVSSIYFDDEDDFKCNIYAALDKLDPDLYEMCANNESKEAYDLVSSQ